MNEVYALPQQSRVFLFSCVALQLVGLFLVVTHPGLNFWYSVLAFFVATYVMDLITCFGHFSFDYVWPDKMPILGPISVEFREHHDAPELDPSALLVNLTKGSYFAILIAIATLAYASFYRTTSFHYFCSAVLWGISFWGLFFHQIHSYTHMGKSVPPDEFNATVARISELPKKDQEAEFAALFERVGIPKWVRFMQKNRLFLRPELHWRHHNSYDSDFSSLNGWSDPLMNLIFGPIARYKMKQQGKVPANPALREKCATQKFIENLSEVSVSSSIPASAEGYSHNPH